MCVCLFLVGKNGVTVVASTDGVTVDHITEEYTSIAHFTRMGYVHNHFDGGFYKHLTAYNTNLHTLDDISGILHSTVDALLATLSDTMNIMIFKPVDVGIEQCLFDILKLCLADDCFNLLHNNTSFN